MNARLIDKTQFQDMPWANGRGITKELYVRKSPQSDRILWRISIAAVDSDGPFSHFPGYDRILILLRGRGIELRHADATEHKLSSAFDIAAFAGDIPTHATLIDGAIKDFNVIVERASFQAGVDIVSPARNELRIDADQLAFYAISADLDVADPGDNHYRVPDGDLLLVDTPLRGRWTASGATAIVIQLQSLK